MNGHATLAALALSLALTSTAHAQPEGSHDARGVLRVGKLYSFGGGADLQHAFGMDLRYELYPDGAQDGYVGLFGSGQYELGDAWRFAGGVAAGWGIFGLEIGLSQRTATAAYQGSTGLHVAQSFTFGPVSVGGRLTIPLADQVERNVAAPPLVQGVEGAITLRLSFGFTVHGPRRAHRGCHAGLPGRRPGGGAAGR